MLKNAESSLPIGLYEDTGPLYGMVLPIFTSVAVTPGVSATALTLIATAQEHVATSIHRFMNSLPGCKSFGSGGD
jgi:hypothetical protein